MLKTLCPLCGKSESYYCFSERSYKLLACENCDLFYIYPYPDENISHEKVSDYSYNNIKILEVSKRHESSKYYIDHYFPLIERECKNVKSVLDVGCGTGRLLELLGKHENINRVGIELNSQRAKFARNLTGCKIYQTPIEEFEYDSKFDVIIMINVLSHIPSFDSLFSSIRSLLAKDGKLILKVGEMTKNVSKHATFDWEIPDHLHFLGMNTISYICNKYGFKIIRHERWPLSTELFSRIRWDAPGRSTFRNIIKRIIARIPFALFLLAFIYDLSNKEIFTSLIVLSPDINKTNNTE